MKIEKSINTLLLFGAVLVLLITAYMTDIIIVNNSVSFTYSGDISLTGSRLSDVIYGKVNKSGVWQSSRGYGIQYDFTLYNNGEFDLTNWSITVDVPAGTVVESAWNVEVDVTNPEHLEFTPVYYNNVLEHNGDISFGFILDSTEDYDITQINVFGYEYYGSDKSIVRKIILGLVIVWGILFVGFIVTRLNLKNYRERQKNDIKIILQSMNTFISFIDAKDPYTRGHSKRVAMYAAEITKRMGLSEDEVQNVYYAGLLHDAGKISVPDAVLNKPGKLSDDEKKAIQNHTIAGGKMLKQFTTLRGVRETALYHHERYDGKGYPEGLKGEAIPLYARIVGVADSYDAMSSNRVYRRHLNKDEIMNEMQKGAGTQFDPNIVTYMVDMINDGYVNVVKMETYDQDETRANFHLTEEDIPTLYMRI
ncbi:HD domain-containing phosphohydrolase [Butyrivibrio proteoclasticus]|uniref:HD domain-containing phosphohydrolase n=1 Tax=Butyrivibrio proteoclasticus TaxID=43305 RepID=UPI0006855BD1|nr:HD domain-containing phosphohydrolase [Butyrivibrio proteoclasticus]